MWELGLETNKTTAPATTKHHEKNEPMHFAHLAIVAVKLVFFIRRCRCRLIQQFVHVKQYKKVHALAMALDLEAHRTDYYWWNSVSCAKTIILS